MTCCLCRRHLPSDKTIHELRRDCPEPGRIRIYHYCRRCWSESRNDDNLRPLQLRRGHSTLAAEAVLNLRTPWEENMA